MDRKWNELDYFKQSPPKSLDASFFENEMLPFVSSVDCNTSDCLRTLVEHISLQLSAVIENKSEPILVTGGGAYNDFLIRNLVSHFGMNIVLPESKLIEFKEALIFAFMGYLKWNGMDNVLSTVTGAPKNHSSGLISLPQRSI